MDQVEQFEISITRTFADGRKSKISADIGSLSPTDGAVLEQIFVTQGVQGLLRIGRYNAEQRDPAFAPTLAKTLEIFNKSGA